jgi:cytidyltransferase-like protein
MSKYKLVVSGGTFDHFHKGHEAFLKGQLALSDKVLLGITSDAYVVKQKHASSESYTKREQAVQTFLAKHRASDRVQICAIDTAGIPKAFENQPIEAIVATEPTKQGAMHINANRQKTGLPPLPIEILQVISAADGKPISSSRIRSGEIGKEGNVYLTATDLLKNYKLPDNMRDNLKEPFGRLIINNEYDYDALAMDTVVTVGDVATKTFIDRALFPKISVIDFLIERKKHYEKHTDIGFVGNEVLISAENPPGTITRSLLRALKKAFNTTSDTTVVVAVHGEEDLAVLPIILLAPLGYAVFYGQPGKGMVLVPISEEQKKYAQTLFAKLQTAEIRS